jgi:hypothetical protein
MSRRLDGPPSLSEYIWKIAPTLGFKPQTIQPVVSCYNNYTILATMTMIREAIKLNFHKALHESNKTICI